MIRGAMLAGLALCAAAEAPPQDAAFRVEMTYLRQEVEAPPVLSNLDPRRSGRRGRRGRVGGQRHHRALPRPRLRARHPLGGARRRPRGGRARGAGGRRAAPRPRRAGLRAARRGRPARGGGRAPPQRLGRGRAAARRGLPARTSCTPSPRSPCAPTRSRSFSSSSAGTTSCSSRAPVTRTGSADPAEIRAFLLSDGFELAGFKGRPLSFRAWNGQLRQPIALAHPRALVEMAPLEGFLHERTDLDTLGLDAPESGCTAFEEASR